jgi:hypothetical protein
MFGTEFTLRGGFQDGVRGLITSGTAFRSFDPSWRQFLHTVPRSSLCSLRTGSLPSASRFWPDTVANRECIWLCPDGPSVVFRRLSRSKCSFLVLLGSFGKMDYPRPLLSCFHLLENGGVLVGFQSVEGTSANAALVSPSRLPGDQY